MAGIWGRDKKLSTDSPKKDELFRRKNEIFFSCEVNHLSVNKLIKMTYEILDDE